MTQDLAAFAAENNVKYFMISFTDLFGGQRAKLVPAQAIADMQKNGAGFAGFATWLDMTPAHPDIQPLSFNCRGNPKWLGWLVTASWKGPMSPKPHVTFCAAWSSRPPPPICMSKPVLKQSFFC